MKQAGIENPPHCYPYTPRKIAQESEPMIPVIISIGIATAYTLSLHRQDPPNEFVLGILARIPREKVNTL